jgi:hypothetical protein
MPVFIAKYNEKKSVDEHESLESSADLLGTIRVPRNLSLLTDRLPKANYETEKKQRVDLNTVAEESIDPDGSQYQRVVGQP